MQRLGDEGAFGRFVLVFIHDMITAVGRTLGRTMVPTLSTVVAGLSSAQKHHGVPQLAFCCRGLSLRVQSL